MVFRTEEERRRRKSVLLCFASLSSTSSFFLLILLSPYPSLPLLFFYELCFAPNQNRRKFFMIPHIHTHTKTISSSLSISNSDSNILISFTLCSEPEWNRRPFVSPSLWNNCSICRTKWCIMSVVFVSSKIGLWRTRQTWHNRLITNGARLEVNRFTGTGT